MKEIFSYIISWANERRDLISSTVFKRTFFWEDTMSYYNLHWACMEVLINEYDNHKNKGEILDLITTYDDENLIIAAYMLKYLKENG